MVKSYSYDELMTQLNQRVATKQASAVAPTTKVATGDAGDDAKDLRDKGNVPIPKDPDATTQACSGSANQVKWCADSANGLQPFSLYRQVGTSCAAATGVNRAGSLNTNLVFSNPTCTAGTRPQLSVSLPVNANIGTATQIYKLSDTITVRNAAVC